MDCRIRIYKIIGRRPLKLPPFAAGPAGYLWHRTGSPKHPGLPLPAVRGWEPTRTVFSLRMPAEPPTGGCGETCHDHVIAAALAPRTYGLGSPAVCIQNRLLLPPQFLCRGASLRCLELACTAARGGSPSPTATPTSPTTKSGLAGHLPALPLRPAPGGSPPKEHLGSEPERDPGSKISEDLPRRRVLPERDNHLEVHPQDPRAMRPKGIID
jgi:hypothetical protein